MIPSLPGSYALRLVLRRETVIQVGRLGRINFLPGEYIYLGSAWGPGGLRARLAHHLRVASKPHWHIDWWRQSAVLVDAWFSTHPVRLECTWSQALFHLPGAFPAFPRFGASDCRSGCTAHLVGFPVGFSMDVVEEYLSALSKEVSVSRVCFTMEE